MLPSSPAYPLTATLSLPTPDQAAAFSSTGGWVGVARWSLLRGPGLVASDSAETGQGHLARLSASVLHRLDGAHWAYAGSLDYEQNIRLSLLSRDPGVCHLIPSQRVQRSSVSSTHCTAKNTTALLCSVYVYCTE